MQETTAKDIDKVIREEGIVDTGVTRAMLADDNPLTPRHLFSAMKVQRALVEKRRNDKFKALRLAAVAANREAARAAGHVADDQRGEMGGGSSASLHARARTCTHPHTLARNRIEYCCCHGSH